MADNGIDANNSGTGEWEKPIGSDGTPSDQYADWLPPSDKEIPYTVDAMGKPTITSPGGHGMPGHKQTFDPQVVAAQAAANQAAAEAAIQARNAAQRRADLAPPQPNVRFTPARKGR